MDWIKVLKPKKAILTHMGHWLDYKELKNRKSFTESITNFNHSSVDTGINRLRMEILRNKNLINFYSSI